MAPAPPAGETQDGPQLSQSAPQNFGEAPKLGALIGLFERLREFKQLRLREKVLGKFMEVSSLFYHTPGSIHSILDNQDIQKTDGERLLPLAAPLAPSCTRFFLISNLSHPEISNLFYRKTGNEQCTV